VGYTIASGNPISVPDNLNITGTPSSFGPQTYGEVLNTIPGSFIQLVAMLEDARFATMSLRHRKYMLNIEQNRINQQIYRASIVTKDDRGIDYQLGFKNNSWFEVNIQPGMFLR